MKYTIDEIDRYLFIIKGDVDEDEARRIVQNRCGGQILNSKKIENTLEGESSWEFEIAFRRITSV